MDSGSESRAADRDHPRPHHHHRRRSALYLIVRGTVDVEWAGPAGEARQLAVLQDGDFFGEIALPRDVPRTATVRTRTPCLLLSLERGQFFQVFDAVPGLRRVFEAAAEARELTTP